MRCYHPLCNTPWPCKLLTPDNGNLTPCSYPLGPLHKNNICLLAGKLTHPPLLKYKALDWHATRFGLPAMECQHF
ncbi:hypothetical protein J6590_033817, partial [Homalodisca vitripennis]